MSSSLTLIISQYLTLLCLGPMSYAFVLLSSSAAAGGSNTIGDIFEPGTGSSYLLESTIFLNGVKGGKNVGFQVEGSVDVGTVWKDPSHGRQRLLKFELKSPKLHIKSRKAPAPEGFVAHASRLEALPNAPFYVLWTNGVIERIYLNENEPLSIVNLKKGISSLFQFQLLDLEIEETDASGKCSAQYTSTGPLTFNKRKINCIGSDLPYLSHPDKIFSNVVESSITAKYELTEDSSAIKSILAEEFHQMKVVIRDDAGVNVKSIQKLTLNNNVKVSTSVINGDDLQSVLRQIEKSSRNKIKEYSLVTEREPACQDECPSFGKLIKENKDALKNTHLGTTKSASVFLKLINAVRRANKDEIIKILRNAKNKNILNQLYDLIGFAQTTDAHDAAIKVLRLDNDEFLDNSERYFWALSMGSHPQELVLRNVLSLSEKDTIVNEKLQETLLLTVAAMAHRFKALPQNYGKTKTIHAVRDSLINGLEFCKNEDCELRYLRALKNLKDESTIPTLLEYALNSTKKSSVAAMKAIRAFPKTFWDANVLTACKKIFYQIGKPYDSSSRTLALDIILNSKYDTEVFLQHLKSNDRAYEVKQYLLQTVRMISEKDKQFENEIMNAIRNDIQLNNYDVLAQKGLTTAFSRMFTQNPSANGSLVTIQEINGGILKRGIVDVVLENGGVSQEIFSLGLFAGGLSSFVSSDDIDATEVDDEPANAGMEITVLGVQVRPFTFFTGQGELMGHVWSGTASEKTPAFQAISLLHDHLEYIRLGTGFVAELNLLSSASFDLSGQIQLSLWNRNAHSLVEKNAGIAVNGQLSVDTSFVRSQVEFKITTEPKLNLVSDIDFSNKISMCMQLKQPDTIFKHNVFKIERIPGSKHKLRKATYKSVLVPGRTYALNRKNNEMCNVIFKEDVY